MKSVFCAIILFCLFISACCSQSNLLLNVVSNMNVSESKNDLGGSNQYVSALYKFPRDLNAKQDYPNIRCIKSDEVWIVLENASLSDATSILKLNASKNNIPVFVIHVIKSTSTETNYIIYSQPQKTSYTRLYSGKYYMYVSKINACLKGKYYQNGQMPNNTDSGYQWCKHMPFRFANNFGKSISDEDILSIVDKIEGHFPISNVQIRINNTIDVYTFRDSFQPYYGIVHRFTNDNNSWKCVSQFTCSE